MDCLDGLEVPHRGAGVGLCRLYVTNLLHSKAVAIII